MVIPWIVIKKDMVEVLFFGAPMKLGKEGGNRGMGKDKGRL